MNKPVVIKLTGNMVEIPISKNKCTYCGRESDSHETKSVGGYTILTCCTDCEKELA